MTAAHQTTNDEIVLRGEARELVNIDIESNWHYPHTSVARVFHVEDDTSLIDTKDGVQVAFNLPDSVDKNTHEPRSFSCYPAKVHYGNRAVTAILAHREAQPALLLVPEKLAQLERDSIINTVTIDAQMNPELVLFDVDGTLVDSLPAYIEVGRLAAATHGYSLSDKFVRDTMNQNNDAFWELVVPATEARRDAIIESLRAESKRHWPRLVEEMVRPFAGVADCLSQLAARGCKTGVVTASGGSSMVALRDTNGADQFDVIITRHDVNAQKPAPDGILKAIDRLSMRPDQTIYVGDSLVDIQAAKAAGVDCIAVSTGAGRPEDLATAGPRRLINRLRALNTCFPMADH